EAAPSIDRNTCDRREQVLGHERHTAKRAVWETRAGGGACLVEEPLDHRVELRIDAFDAGDGLVHKLARAHLSPADQLGHRHRVQTSVLGDPHRGGDPTRPSPLSQLLARAAGPGYPVTDAVSRHGGAPMSPDIPREALQLRSTVKAEGTVEVAL